MVYALSLPGLPVEVIELIFEGLSKPDILSLRITSHLVSCVATRVMLSLLAHEILHEHKTYLHTAISSHRHTLVAGLLASGTRTDSPGINKCTPLHTAARTNCVTSLRLLLQKGANVDAEDKFGWTALQLAARYGREGIVSILIANGADVNKEGFRGWTAWYYAQREGHTRVETLLIHNGAKVTETAAENFRTGRLTGWGQWSLRW